VQLSGGRGGAWRAPGAPPAAGAPATRARPVPAAAPRPTPRAAPTRAPQDDACAALEALRDANPGSELPELWRGAPSGAWPGLKQDEASGALVEL
jgi:hypothetical protein